MMVTQIVMESYKTLENPIIALYVKQGVLLEIFCIGSRFSWISKNFKN